MIVPSRWFAGGKGLDEFRNRFLNDEHVSLLEDYWNSKECFPNVDVAGGVCYFLWDREKTTPLCRVNSHNYGRVFSSDRALNEFPIFVRDSIAVSVIHKVREKNNDDFTGCVSVRCPFGFETNYRGKDKIDNNHTIKYYSSKGVSFVSPEEITCGQEMIGKYKIMMSRATSEHANIPSSDGKYRIISTLKILDKNEVCSDSYLIVYPTDDLNILKNVMDYMKTKLFRFLLQQSLTSIVMSKDKFCFVPLMDFSRQYTDQDLYNYFNLSQQEIDYIESLIKPVVGDEIPREDGELNE